MKHRRTCGIDNERRMLVATAARQSMQEARPIGAVYVLSDIPEHQSGSRMKDWRPPLMNREPPL